MDFDRASLDRNIRLGYNDTMKAFGKYHGRLYTFMGSDETMNRLEKLSKDFTYEITRAETYPLKEKQRLFQRNAVNAPCTRRLADYSGKNSPTMLDFLISAIEITARLLAYPDDLLYSFESIFQMLRLDAHPIRRAGKGLPRHSCLQSSKGKEQGAIGPQAFGKRL